jgi:PAS domain-containing protein
MKLWELRGVTVDVVPRHERAPIKVDGREPLRTLVDQFPAAFWTTDPQLRFTSLLGAGLPAMGLGPNQVVGTSLEEFFETEDPQFGPIAAHLRALGGETVPFQMHRHAGRWHCQVAPLYDSVGDQIGTIGLAVEAVARAF